MKKRVIFFVVAAILLTAVVFTNCEFQSRSISRITGKALELKLPADFDRPISFSSGRDGEKDLFYWTKSGEMKVKTYTDFGVLESEIVFK